jgi:mRNA interferase RelE/StbE
MYTIFIEEKARKTLKKLPSQFRIKINHAISSLAFNPRPFGYKKLKNRNYFRIRIADYRVLYTIDEKDIKVMIIHLGHRKDVYKFLI